MRRAAVCPACAAPGHAPLAAREFRPPSARDFAACRDYVERRLHVLFRGMLPGAESARFTLRHCPACDLLFLDPRFEARELAAKYATLTAAGSTAGEYARRPVRHADGRARRIAGLLGPLLAPARGARRVLDFGGQFGHNLAGFPAPAWERLLVDHERNCREPDVRQLGPDLAAVEEASCDAILANHIVEHLAEPLGAVRELAGKLSPGGLLLVEVPLGAFREAWAFREPVTHANFFSEASLAALLTTAGLALEALETRFQWVTTGAEWCLNAVARRGGDGGPRRDFRRPRTAFATRRRPSLYPRVLFEKVRLCGPLGRLFGPPV